MGPRLLFALFGLVVSAEAIPAYLQVESPAIEVDVEAEMPRSFIDHWRGQLTGEHLLTDALTAAATSLGGAVVQADHYQSAVRDEALLDSAAEGVRRRDFTQGQAEAQMFLEIPQEPRAARRAHDIAALASAGLGEHEAVLQHLDAMPADEGARLEPYRQLWRARAALALERGAEAHTAASLAADLSPRSPILHEARITRALALLDTEDGISEGIRAVERELERYPEYPFLDRVQIRVARAELDLGRQTAAAHRLEQLVWDRPYSPRADEARALHEEFSGPIDEARGTLSERLERGRLLRRARHWSVAEDVLRAALADAIETRASRSLTNEIRFQLALNGYDSGRFEDALAELDDIAANRNSGVSFYNRATWRARTLSRLDREEEAYETLASYYAERSGSERDQRLFEFASDMGMWDVALGHLDNRYSRERDWESWDGAFTNYMAGNHDRAAHLWGRMARRHSGESEARYQYWQARAYEHLGRIPEALELYDTVVQSQPWRYYGIQARNRTHEWLEVLPVLEEGQEYVDLQVELPQVPASGPGRVHWDGFGNSPSGTFTDLQVEDYDEFFGGYPEELQSTGAVQEFADAYGEQFPEALLAAELMAVGAKEDARKELRDAIIEFRALDYSFVRGRRVTETRPIRLGHKQWAMFIDNRSPELGWWGIELNSDRFPTPSGRSSRRAYAQRQMLLRENRDEVRGMIRAAAREAGDYYMVRRFALDGDLDTLSEGTPDVRWHEAYPRAYGESMREHIEEYDLNPFIAWALMIVESDMNPDTVSHAFAYGLLQVIPKTGTLCALLFGEADFGINELLEVDGSIRYGTWYLNQLLYKFHGQEMLAMVAYNAGPHQVQRWLEWRGDVMTMDEFIETVPYDGARRYPQRILRYVSIFRAVNGMDREVYLGNELDDTYEDNIYF